MKDQVHGQAVTPPEYLGIHPEIPEGEQGGFGFYVRLLG